MSPWRALPAAFVDAVASAEHETYRKGYRSFRRVGSEQAPTNAAGGRAAAAAQPQRVPIPSVASAMRRFEGTPAQMRKVPSSLSVDSLGHHAETTKRRQALGIAAPDSDDDVAEPHLAASPFRLRCGARRERPWGELDACTEYAPDLMQLGGRPLAAELSALAALLRGAARRRPPGAQPDAAGASADADELAAEVAVARAQAAARQAAAAASRRSTLLFVVVWYFTGAFTNSSSKQALASLPMALPLTLTAVQHAAAALLGCLVYRVAGLQPYKPLPSRSEMEGGARSALGWLCVVYSLGFALTNASFGAVNASFVDTVKAAEPISTVALAVIFLANERITLRVLLALVPIVGGVGISSMAEASASVIGLCFALGSNCCFSARSIAAKLVGKRLGSDRMDGANLFVHVNRLGLWLLLPAALALEGRQLLALGAQLPADRLSASLRLFGFNGLMYYLNNQMNFLVLEQVDTLTHGIINCGRRVANILFAILWFGNRVTPSNATGISLALAGGLLYVRAKLEDGREARALLKRSNEGAKEQRAADPPAKLAGPAGGGGKGGKGD